jgi:hypothetical protein
MMVRKTSKFMRKRMTQGRVVNGEVLFKPNAWIEKIHDCKPYDDMSICGEVTTMGIAKAAIGNSRSVLEMLINRTVKANDVYPHDLLSHCIGVTQIRVAEMGGDGSNDVMQRLNNAAESLLRTRTRWESSNVWGLDGPAINHLRDALDIYDDILIASGPALMEAAQKIRTERVKNHALLEMPT